MQAIPFSWFSWNFQIRDGRQQVCEVKQKFFREQATFVLDGRTHTLGRQSGWGEFWVRQGGDTGTILARGKKVSFLSRRFEVEAEVGQLELVPNSLFTGGFTLRRGNKAIGSIHRPWFSRKLDIELPDDLPLALRVFLVWLVMLMYRRKRRRD